MSRATNNLMQLQFVKKGNQNIFGINCLNKLNDLICEV